MTAARRGVSDLLADWQATRALLREIEQAEHPDVIDRHGRAWQWKSGDLYSHDATLAYPLDIIQRPDLNLPPVGLADQNPNYAGLCAVCRHTATEEPTT